MQKSFQNFWNCVFIALFFHQQEFSFHFIHIQTLNCKFEKQKISQLIWLNLNHTKQTTLKSRPAYPKPRAWKRPRKKRTSALKQAHSTCLNRGHSFFFAKKVGSESWGLNKIVFVLFSQGGPAGAVWKTGLPEKIKKTILFKPQFSEQIFLAKKTLPVLYLNKTLRRCYFRLPVAMLSGPYE